MRSRDIKIQFASGTLRTSVPVPIAKYLDIKKGDTIIYKIGKTGEVVIKKKN